jgi:catechol 2,3-dioxygenase-like lactoylglutathione lyase family enzyme
MKGIEGMITFTYHEDIEAADRFYGETLGLERVMDRDWVKIFKLGRDSHVGLVDSERGHLKPSEEKPVMLTIIVEDAEEWQRELTEKGVKTNHPPKEAGERLPDLGPLGVRHRNTRVPDQALRREMDH